MSNRIGPRSFDPTIGRTVPRTLSQAMDDLVRVQTSGIWRAMPDIQRRLNLLNESSLQGAYNRAINDLARMQSVRTSLLPSNRFMNEIATSLPRMERITHAAVSSALELNRSIETRARFTISDSVVKSIASTHLDFSNSYADLLRAFNEPVSESVPLRPAILTLPPVEHYNASRLMVEVFSPEDSDDSLSLEDESEDESGGLTLKTEYALEDLLSELDERLVTPWRGAVNAILSENPDRIRHAAVSMRELFTQILDILAPNSEVIGWSHDPNHLHDGRPTRRARLLYICRNSNHQGFSKFLEKDIDSYLGMTSLFQTGVHSLDSPFSDGQMIALRVRIEGAIRLLIETARP